MNTYVNPVIEVLIFDEEEDILTLSAATNAEKQLNKYMFDEDLVTSTTSIKVQSVKIK